METNAIIKIKYSLNLLPLLGVLSLLLIMVFLTAPAYAQTQQEHQKKQPSRAGTGEVISHREIVLKPEIDPAEFEKWVVEYFNPALEGLIPGIRAYVAKADRGVRNGKYAYIVLYDSYNTRQAYQPEMGKLTEYFSKIFFEPNKYLHDELFQYIEMSSWTEFTFSDWVVLR